MANAPLSEVPVIGDVACSCPSTQISAVLPRFTPATWCQVPSKMSLVEVALPPEPPSNEKTAFAFPEVPRPYWWTGPAAALVNQLAFVLEDELTNASMVKSLERRLRLDDCGRSMYPAAKLPAWPTLPATWLTLTGVASFVPAVSLPGVPAVSNEYCDTRPT